MKSCRGLSLISICCKGGAWGGEGVKGKYIKREIKIISKHSEIDNNFSLFFVHFLSLFFIVVDSFQILYLQTFQIVKVRPI